LFIFKNSPVFYSTNSIIFIIVACVIRVSISTGDACAKIFIFKHFFRVRQFFGVWYVAKASKQGLLKKSLVPQLRGGKAKLHMNTAS